MSASPLEIVELRTGEIVLRRSDEPDVEPLLTLKFSDEAHRCLLEDYLQVAKAMFDAGMLELAAVTSPYRNEDDTCEHRVLH
ncbi:hypothetical protein NX722_10360 [Endozoicomonas gorgoniicola]|uniref:Uncharacterized protein n=1 Tax=Endozoicomonas gorgoniicola TaxID=1234144 RepID=A0ABT3MVK6_9GAMM|nr:hypothetical protein [Endozoicomonas gorgoniicola]MCW7553034.1 hypothetical protein [Endozoicomonas gorgoniicola]